MSQFSPAPKTTPARPPKPLPACPFRRALFDKKQPAVPAECLTKRLFPEKPARIASKEMPGALVNEGKPQEFLKGRSIAYRSGWYVKKHRGENGPLRECRGSFAGDEAAGSAAGLGGRCGRPGRGACNGGFPENGRQLGERPFV